LYARDRRSPREKGITGKVIRRLNLSNLVLLLLSAIGLGVLLYPFWAPGTAGADQSRAALLVLSGALAMILAALLVETQSGLTAHTVALIGTLVGLNAMIRVIETVLPLPGGFSPVFLLMILVGHIFGARLGFLMGSLTMLVSGPLTAGGLGPWTPYQMLAAGWVGMGAAWLPTGRGRLLGLALYGVVCGFAYGLLTDLQYWPYALGAPDLSWTPGLDLPLAIGRFARFYAVTSAVWDTLRSAGNVVLILLLAHPLTKALERFHRRARVVWEPADARL
jgi:energy-coupling factor transport system substrate-specific component